MSNKYILDGHKAVLEPDLMKWAEWIEGNQDAKRVALTKTETASVSTVFLGLDHSFGYGPPALFETMIFGGEHDQFTDRYSTWEEAEAGHQRAVALLCPEKETS